MFVDKETNELYVADGYGNHRVIVFDADTGKYKRHWGAYGNKPDDADLGRYDPNAPPAQQFRNPVHCADLSVDRLLYVCDRVNDRIQVFKPDGTFVKEGVHQQEDAGLGSVWDIAFSKDPQQKYIYLADGENEKVLRDPARHARDADELRRRRPAARRVLRRAQHRHRFEGQHLHDRDLPRPARAKFVYKGLAPVTKRIRAWSGRNRDQLRHVCIRHSARVPREQGCVHRGRARVQRIVNSLATSAEERYEAFLAKYPSIALRVPQWMLASYLGVSPETLSRVRKSRSRK